jgi:segregation and condensation protein B
MKREKAMDDTQIKYVLEAALLAAGRPLDLNTLQQLFGAEQAPGRDELRQALDSLQADYADRGIVLKEVASGFRIQVRPSMTGFLAPLWAERAPRYSRALMETLAIIAYRQPVTRGDVEEIRGVGVTTNIMRTLLERNWIRVVGFRDVPGKPAIYGTTREFLDYFGLKRLDELPPLAELKDLETFAAQLDLADGDGLPGGPELASVTPISEARGFGLADRDMADEQVDEPVDGDNVVPLKSR